MKFSIYTLNDNGTGIKHDNKEAFMKEIEAMVDDCIRNGGTYFIADIVSDKSCFHQDNE